MDLDIENKYFEEIKKIENKYYNLLSYFNTNFPKILNLETEKKTFFKALADDKIYNPKFKYEKKYFNKEKFEELKDFEINIDNDIYNFKKLYRERIKTKILELESRRIWGLEKSTKYVKLFRGEPSLFLLFKAKKFAKKFIREKIKFKTLTPQIAAKRLCEEVALLTGDKINVEYSNISSKVNITPNTNLIKINPKERFTSLDIKRLKVHEIGVHYLRYYNGRKAGIKILENGTSNYIETEEGLAVYVEKEKGVSSSAQMFIYAGRVIATYYALRKSFYEVFKILKKYKFRDDAAFTLTLRAKRNLCDTSKKGGFTKDYVYFSGYLKIKKFAKKNDIKDLFIGKIKIDDIKLLRKFIDKNKDKIKTIFD